MAGRPLSPHLQVYRLPLTALASISHRITGVALGLGTVLLAWWLIAAASGPAAYDRFQACAGSWAGLVVLFGFTAALFFHLLNGIRHLFWDAGWGLEKIQAHQGSIAVLAGTAGLTVAVWLVALAL